MKMAKMEYKKAQAALEFLMTYGWAIMVVLVAISALSYFGVLSPDNFLPNKCSFPAGISCVDFEYDIISDIPTLKFVIKNNLGWDVTGVSIFPYETDPSIPQIGSVSCGNSAGGANALKNGDQSTYIIECDQLLPKGKVRTNLIFSYAFVKDDPNEPSIQRFTFGTLFFNVE